MVKKINPNGSKTLYIGGVYEVDKDSGGTVISTKTYYPEAGAMRITDQTNNTLYYVLKDHLGSASMTTNSSGGIVGEQGYYAFGQTRFTINTMPTDKLFTGQREITGLGIYYYNARFYSPYINRFISADTIVPGYTNPQNLNRYSYVRNNPILYRDPTGHGVDCGIGMGCVSAYTPPTTSPTTTTNNNNDDDNGITLTRDDLNKVQNQAEDLASYYQQASNWWEYGVGAATGLLINLPGCFAGGVFTGLASCAGSAALTVAVLPGATNLAGQLGGGMQADTASYLAEQIEDVLINNASEQFTVTIGQQTNYQGALMLPGGSPIGTVVQTSTINIQGSNGYSETITITDASFAVLGFPSSIVDSSFAGEIP